jgi:hypothetical protein
MAFPRECSEQFAGDKNGVSVDGAVKGMGRMLGLGGKRRRGIAHQRDVVPKTHAEFARGLQTDVG